MSEKRIGKDTVNSRALSIYVGSALLPSMDGKPQRKMTAKQAYEKAKRERKHDGC